jgi:hypothetical protein
MPSYSFFARHDTTQHDMTWHHCEMKRKASRRWRGDIYFAMLVQCYINNMPFSSGPLILSSCVCVCVCVCVRVFLARPNQSIHQSLHYNIIGGGG